VNATRSRSTPSGKYGAAYSSQIHCNAKMVGTYTVDPLGTGTMTINFTPERGSPTCGASTGLFDIVLVSDRLVEVASSGQIMADPSKGEFNAYVVHAEIIKRSRPRTSGAEHYGAYREAHDRYKGRFFTAPENSRARPAASGIGFATENFPLEINWGFPYSRRANRRSKHGNKGFVGPEAQRS
jgi:hypothetical protein